MVRAAAKVRAAPGFDPAGLLAAAAIAASAALLLALTEPLTFLLDDWAFLTLRRGFTETVILEPHNEHIVIGPVLAYKALLDLFGMDSARPFQVLATAVSAGVGTLLYVYLRRRLDRWLALAATVLVLFCGAAWEDLLWSFQLGLLTSVATGLGTLLALERRSRGGDLAAGGLLTASVLFSSIGLPFLAGAAVAIWLEPGRLRRAWIVAVPAALYAGWWLGWGQRAESVASFQNLLESPVYVIEGLASSLASLLGLASPHDWLEAGPLTLGLPLLGAATGLAVWRLARLGTVPRGLWVVGAIGICFWFLAALNTAGEAREPTTSRYQYVGVLTLVLIAAELLRGVRPGPRALLAVAVVCVAAVGANIVYLVQAQREFEQTSELIRADLGALEIARDHVDPALPLSADIAGTLAVPVVAGTYLAAVDELGSPAASPTQIEVAPEPAREAADKVLMRALGLTFTPLTAPQRAAGCERLELAGGAQAVTAVSAPGAVLSAAGGAELRLRRFATESFPIEVGALGAGEAAELSIPADRADRTWELAATGSGKLAVCDSPDSAG